MELALLIISAALSGCEIINVYEQGYDSFDWLSRFSSSDSSYLYCCYSSYSYCYSLGLLSIILCRDIQLYHRSQQQNKSAMQQRMSSLQGYAALYKAQLLDQIIPFWSQHSLDHEHGGYFTCLDEKGAVYDTDKFMWLQGRQVWTFAMLYNNLAKKGDWLQIALHGATFMEKFGRDKEGNWYFSVTREGQPLVQPYNIFSDCFAAMAFGQLYKATKEARHKQMAVQTFQNIQKRRENPKGVYNKSHPGSRHLRNFSLPMILCNLALILEEVVGTEVVDQMVPPLIEDILGNFVDQDKGIIRENVGQNGEFLDCFQGRLVNPGHGNQSMWFLIDLAVRYKRDNLIKKCGEILLKITKFGWDQKHGGIFYFLDIKGHPVQQLQWDQKLWWVHIESMISFLKAYKYTGNPEYKEWFIKLHDYTWKHFRDPQNEGDWFGYLDRRGEVLLRLKGGKWKGCFHVPRGLFQLWKTIQEC